MVRKKIFYVPGLISLMGLPILLLLFAPGETIRHNALRMFLPPERMEETSFQTMSKSPIETALQGKAIIAIHGQDNLDDEFATFLYNRKFEFIRNEIERLQFTHDTNTVLQVEFGEENTYGDFVWLVNQCVLYRIKRYTFIDNNFYVFVNPHVSHHKDERVLDFYEGTFASIDQPSRWEKIQYWINETLITVQYIFRRNWLVVTGFLLLILVPAMRAMLRSKKEGLS